MEITPIFPPIPVPGAFELPGPTLDVPLINAPRWTPIPMRNPDPSVPLPNPAPAQPFDEQEEEEEKEEEEKEEEENENGAEALLPQYDNSITIPIVGTELPLPENEVMIITATTATIAAVASVGGALIGKTIFDYLLKLIKPTIKTTVNKILKALGKKPPTWSRARMQGRQRILRDRGWKGGSEIHSGKY